MRERKKMARVRFTSKWIEDALLPLADFEPHVYSQSKDGRSYYVRFGKIPHSLRISNHDGRGKYHYRWNLRDDVLMPERRIVDGYIMYFYPLEMSKKMADHMKKEYNFYQEKQA